MIANERQYRITKAWVQKFEEGAQHADEAAAGLDPLLRQAMQDQYEGQAAELRAQLAEYDALRGGRVASVALRSMADLPLALIKARIAAGLTHKQLADRLQVSEQQIQRDEARLYRGVRLDRLLAIADALGIKTRGRVFLPHQSSGTTGRPTWARRQMRSRGHADWTDKMADSHS